MDTDVVMRVFELRSHTSTVGLFASVDGAKAAATKELAGYHRFAAEEALDPEVWIRPLTTDLTWEMRRHRITRRHLSEPMPPAQYDHEYAFTIVEVAVGP